MRRAARSASGTRAGRAGFSPGASRSGRRMRTVSRSKPASGTSRSSGPPDRPTMRTAPSGSSARYARATASAGNRCPPVPPPAIKSLITTPIVAERRSRPVPRDAQEHADRGQRGRQRGAAVAEERKRDPGDRQGVGHSRHVEQRLEGDPGGDRRGERHAEAVWGTQRGSIAADPEGYESEHHQRRADQAGLLADDREDEVRGRLGKPAVLLDRMADPHPKDSA